jgi:hypothetical protein
VVEVGNGLSSSGVLQGPRFTAKAPIKYRTISFISSFAMGRLFSAAAALILYDSLSRYCSYNIPLFLSPFPSSPILSSAIPLPRFLRRNFASRPSFKPHLTIVLPYTDNFDKKNRLHATTFLLPIHTSLTTHTSCLRDPRTSASRPLSCTSPAR